MKRYSVYGVCVKTCVNGTIKTISFNHIVDAHNSENAEQAIYNRMRGKYPRYDINVYSQEIAEASVVSA